MRAKVRTSHFERLKNYSKKRGADNATDQVLPYPRRGPWQDLALARQSPNEPLRAAEKLFQKARGRQCYRPGTAVSTLRTEPRQDLALARQSPNEPLRAAGKLFQKARGRQKLLTRYCCFHPAGNHLPLSINGNLRQSFGFASRGRTWRLRAKVRTSHFERLESYSKKRGADKSLPRAFWSY